MIRRAWGKWRRCTNAPVLSPKSLLLWAGRLAALFAVLHLVGLREHAAILSGTAVGGSLAWSGFWGLTYVSAWFGFVLGTPACLLGAAIAAVASRELARAATQPAATPPEPLPRA